MRGKDQFAYSSLETDTELTPQPDFKTRQVIVTLITVCLIQLGDGVEMILPAVLTQKISCDLNLTEREHQMLSVVSYAFYVVGSLSSRRCANKIGRKNTIIVSLSCSMVVSITAALSHNLLMLTVSRAFTGLLVGSNMALIKVYWMESAANTKLKTVGIFLLCLGYDLGSGFTFILAYFILDLYSWRTFFVICSVPIFIIPLLTLVFYLKETEVYQRLTTEEDAHKMSLSTIFMVVQLSFVYFINMSMSMGQILLVPKIYAEENAETGRNLEECNMVSGGQFLKMAVILSLVPFLEKCLSTFVFFIFGHPILNLLLSSCLSITGYFILTAVSCTKVESDIILGMVSLAFTYFNMTFWLYMTNAFGEGQERSNATFIADGIGKTGAIVGTLIVAFLATSDVTLCMGVMGVIQVILLALIPLTGRFIG